MPRAHSKQLNQNFSALSLDNQVIFLLFSFLYKASQLILKCTRVSTAVLHASASCSFKEEGYKVKSSGFLKETHINWIAMGKVIQYLSISVF